MTTLAGIYLRFPSHETCIGYLEALRWRGLPLCPYCGTATISRHREAQRDDRWQCQACLRSFTVTVGTVFHRTHVDLRKWFALISLMLGDTPPSTAAQASRELQLRRATIARMMHRIRSAIADDDDELLQLIAGTLKES